MMLFCVRAPPRYKAWRRVVAAVVLGFVCMSSVCAWGLFLLRRNHRPVSIRKHWLLLAAYVGGCLTLITPYGVLVGQQVRDTATPPCPCPSPYALTDSVCVAVARQNVPCWLTGISMLSAPYFSLSHSARIMYLVVTSILQRTIRSLAGRAGTSTELLLRAASSSSQGTARKDLWSVVIRYKKDWALRANARIARGYGAG